MLYGKAWTDFFSIVGWVAGTRFILDLYLRFWFHVRNNEIFFHIRSYNRRLLKVLSSYLF